MNRLFIILAFVGLTACSGEADPSDNNSNQDSGTTVDAGSDVGTDASAPNEGDAGNTVADANSVDQGGNSDTGGGGFCQTVDCSAETPVCSEGLQRCVQCLSDNDCSVGSLRTCDVTAVGDEEPSYACVECVDDSVCAGGSCDLSSHTCGP